MNLNRRRALTRLSTLAWVSATALLPALASAQDYPKRAITAVVPVAAGGAFDALARAWADQVSKSIGVPVVVDNKTGANGSVAASYVAKQPADGYTLLFGSTSNMSLNPFSYKALPYNPTRDFDPVLMLATSSQVLVANPNSGIKSLNDLVRLAKEKPGALNFGSAGKGNSTHLNVEFVAQHFGLDLTHVPYRGAAPALMGVMAGDTQFMSDAIVTASIQAKLGKVVPLVVFGARRSPALPDVPTILEAGVKDFPIGGWYGLMAPKGTPKAVIDRLNAETRKFWADPAVKARMDGLYMEQLEDNGPDAVTRMMQREAAVWGPIITKLGIQNE
ncbi:tripartite tricarboxylate transporter substrate binding protein [Hydrogenophaga sp.]|uniref:Bug family tripartite tricarboxylate transporter substrate binding protein n=1 Tax=Hydrogenophaga sp. TaxID=1904254 RepID=UPI0027289C2E|nr:tripartite tricarboxylate transporter substrate binding protein [Hydrogenophaga sp.]MDO9132624.1 tripartite tricarboxylate transporter substrate binding protein [Hydrogenophaga sp.]MDP2073909.1 tripartite tricarboxylate transporter substrate binding protein [Hydrogenophaga sp.]MDP3107367.1 tripartite tricarboxylate transporter substrate binding protein [Hydrogenophaga sp.]MDP3349949.1 tripartite tricarboxylate transporter substrate binding protein [Hydrogenophaga sp.]MDZ4279722.1 tripartite